MPNLLFALTGDFESNSRGIRQIRSRVRAGWSCTVLHTGNPVPSSTERGFCCISLPQPAASGPAFFRQIHKAFAHEAAKHNPDIFHASDLYALPALAKIAQDRQKLLVFDSRELYHHVAGTVGKPWSRFFWHRIQAKHLKNTNLIFTVSDSIADSLASTFGINQPTVLHNLPEHGRPTTTLDLRKRVGISERSFVVLHQGQMRADRGCNTLIEAASHLSDIQVIFLGNGPEKGNLEKYAQNLNVSDRVHFSAAVPPDELLKWTASADIGVSLLKNSCKNHRFALPNKFFEYLTAGVPVIASNLPEMASFVSKYDVGLVVPPNTSSLVKGLESVLDNRKRLEEWKRNTLEFVSDHNWQKTERAFDAAYNSIL